MTIGTVLIVFWGIGLLLFCAFIFGYFRGRDKDQKDHAMEALQRAKSDMAFAKEKEKIQADIHENAEGKKAALSRGTGRKRFNAIADSLRDDKD
jgi:hypothetical protein